MITNINQVREVTSPDDCNTLLDEGWHLLAALALSTSIHYSLGRYVARPKPATSTGAVGGTAATPP